jgi:hypothetical protein
MITKSEKITEISSALLEAQRAIDHAIKNAVNPFFKCSYADLTEIIRVVKEPLNANNITFLQAVGFDGALPTVETILLHKNGEYISTITPVYCAKEKDPQAFGSALTYSKRYALMAILGLPTADDDGEAGKGEDKVEPVKPTKQQEKVLIAVYEKLLDSVPEGKKLIQSKVGTVIFSLGGKYPDDITKAGTIAAWLIAQKAMDELCEPEQK